MRDDEVAEYRLLAEDVLELSGVIRDRAGQVAARRGRTHAQWHALIAVADGELTVPAMADRLGLTRQAVHRVVGDLVDDGMLERRDNPAHQRSPLVSLTDAGRDVIDALAVDAAARWREIDVAPGVAALAETRKLLQSLTLALRDLDDPGEDDDR